MRTIPLSLSLRAAGALVIIAPTLALIAGAAHAQMGGELAIRIGRAPPPLPIYDQPPLPGRDYVWVPGYWAWSAAIDDYAWVEGFWEHPPRTGLLWTPAWWGWDSDAYLFHQGYWGRSVGWYGGIDYGHGYHGRGWEGGRWVGGHVAYRRHAERSRAPRPGPRISYSGGNGGIAARPPGQGRPGPRFEQTPAQQQREREAAGNPRAAAGAIDPAWRAANPHRIDPGRAPQPMHQPPGVGEGPPRRGPRPAAIIAPPRPPALIERDRPAPADRPRPHAQQRPDQAPIIERSHPVREAGPAPRSAPPVHAAPPPRPAVVRPPAPPRPAQRPQPAQPRPPREQP